MKVVVGLILMILVSYGCIENREVSYKETAIFDVSNPNVKLIGESIPLNEIVVRVWVCEDNMGILVLDGESCFGNKDLDLQSLPTEVVKRKYNNYGPIKVILGKHIYPNGKVWTVYYVYMEKKT